MLGELSKLTDDELLYYFMLILSRPGQITARDVTEIGQIESEYIRRTQHPIVLTDC